MTADQCLDQLEPLVAQVLAVSDRHTAQLKQLVNFAIQQSENMDFVLRTLLEVKEQLQIMNEKQQTLDSKQQMIDGKLQTIEDRQQGMDTKLDRILGLLGGSGK
ncbi:hypothetical protein [uncultured Hymenobacter sp.]|uniref:hypothetical protein n=1 Tax=uncultured Hymenobacter sp. TaxID=170016 RepID=UPI0035C9EF56